MTNSSSKVEARRKRAAYVGSQRAAGRTRKSIAEELGISVSRVRQLEAIHRHEQDEVYWGLSTRARTCLRNEGISPTDKEAIRALHKRGGFNTIPNVGAKTLKEIEAWIST